MAAKRGQLVGLDLVCGTLEDKLVVHRAAGQVRDHEDGHEPEQSEHAANDKMLVVHVDFFRATARIRNAKSEIRISKSETNSKSEARNHKSQRFENSNFGFVSDFGIRISDFILGARC